MKIYEIDGVRFSNLDEFYDEINQVLGLSPWGRNMDAFNDILRGGFGTPEEGFILRWRNHELSKERLGYPETVRYLEKKLGRCHPANRAAVAADLDEARHNRGLTVFDILVDIIRIHGEGGPEAQDKVVLELD